MRGRGGTRRPDSPSRQKVGGEVSGPPQTLGTSKHPHEARRGALSTRSGGREGEGGSGRPQGRGRTGPSPRAAKSPPGSPGSRAAPPPRPPSEPGPGGRGLARSRRQGEGERRGRGRGRVPLQRGDLAAAGRLRLKRLLPETAPHPPAPPRPPARPPGNHSLSRFFVFFFKLRKLRMRTAVHVLPRVEERRGPAADRAGACVVCACACACACAGRGGAAQRAAIRLDPV